MATSFRHPALTLALFAFLLLAGASAAIAYEPPLGELATSADERVLRLHDLPPGYRTSNDGGCGRVSGEDEQGALRQFVLANPLEVCGYPYERLFEVPGVKPTAPLVGAGVLAAADANAAARLFELAIASLKERTGKEAARELAPAPAIGEEARLFRTAELVDGRFRPGTIVIWRQGSFVGSLVAAGLGPVANGRIALELAAVQQARMLSPSPYTEAEKNEVAVPLDDPWIRFPVFWLGQDFRPGHGLPATELSEVFTIKRRGEGPPGQKLSLWYEGFTMGIWTRPGWQSFKRSALGPLNSRWRCTSSTRVELDAGYGDVFAAYGKKFRVCPKRAPNRYYAIAHLGRVVVGVNLIQCTRCLGPGSGPYNSLKGMKAIVRGLELRPKPVY